MVRMRRRLSSGRALVFQFSGNQRTSTHLAVVSQVAFGLQGPWLLHQRIQSCELAQLLLRHSFGVDEMH